MIIIHIRTVPIYPTYLTKNPVQNVILDRIIIIIITLIYGAEHGTKQERLAINKLKKLKSKNHNTLKNLFLKNADILSNAAVGLLRKVFIVINCKSAYHERTFKGTGHFY